MRARSHCPRRKTTLLSPAAAIFLVLLAAPAASAAAATHATVTTAQRGLAGTASRPSLLAGDTIECPGALHAGQAQCMSILDSSASSARSVPGFSPAALRSAYGLTTAAARNGRRATVAIVSAYSDPRAAADLAVYRKHFGLPACTKAGKCLRIVNEHGHASGLPTANSSWAGTEATGLEIVSALCPNCHLLLVEASGTSLTDLGIAEDTAVAAGAKFVVNGWVSQEAVGQDVYDHYFNHPGVAIVAPSGISGDGRSFPGDLPYVTSVGGTSLTRSSANTRHWAETAWADTGSGCSALEAKPSWQRADATATTGCLNRTQNDVAADADPSTGAALYDTYGTKKPWNRAGSTTVAAAIITAAYALAGTPAVRTYPASYPYQHPGHLNDVKFGSNGACGLNPPEICNAGPGFDGPTGLGTPWGTTAFAAKGTDPVTVMDPGTQDAEEGASVSFAVTGLDSRRGAALQWAASGLPAGLSIASVPHSTNATLTGSLPAAVSSYAVTVTATDTKTHKSASTRFAIVAAGSLTPSAPVDTQIVTDIDPTNGGGSECLDGGAETAGTAVTVQLCAETLQQNDWEYVPEGAPGGPAEITLNGLCLGLTSGAPTLQSCDQSDATQGWRLLTNSDLQNTGSGTCLNPGSSATGPLTLQACDSTPIPQQWQVNRGTMQSAVPGICIASQDNPPKTGPVDVEPCGQTSQDYGFAFDPGNKIQTGYTCLATQYGGLVEQSFNSPCGSWALLPGGELMDQLSGFCAADPGDATNAGTQLDLEPCYGTLGEIWAIW
ncbi:MAG TPA: ricin-type beta-trefoil lectin domain protein [Streptosporangiaceae bacterium]|nr:ricin-type beta-trefoil lectin domain protein [Streptosporangiaceae bacterium]